MKSIQGCAIKVGDLVYDEETETFQRVIATHGEQGSGSRPSRAWVAYEGNPRIAEIDIFAHYIVKRAEGCATKSEAQTDSSTFVEVVCQVWEESERGWGVRPDGYSLHLTLGDHKAWMAAYLKRLPPPPAPDEYSRPVGEPKTLLVDADTHTQLVERKKAGHHGLTLHKLDPSKHRIP